MQQAMPKGIHLSSVAKSYGPTVALEGVSMTLQPGQVQAILGENGAGKSTLVKILSGVVSPNSGTMTMDAETYAPHSLQHARKLGVSTAFQELSLLPNLSVAQNFFLPHAPKNTFGLPARKRMQQQTEAILHQHDVFDISPQANVESLSLAARQRLEIVRAMHLNPRLLILDEPTGALADVEWLFRLVRRLTQQGSSVLYISHRLAEIREIASHATVLRSGKSIETVDLSAVTNDDIFALMVGRRSSQRSATRHASATTAHLPRLVTNDLSGTMFEDVSLELHQGEIVGVAALEGQGQRELFRTLAGLMKPDSGQIQLDGHVVNLRHSRDALNMHSGIAFVPEDRKSEGIFPTMSTAANVTPSVLSRFTRLGMIKPDTEQEAISTVAPRVELSARYLNFKIGTLSGGNQQKALIARALLSGAKTLLLFDPTRGVDVGTKEIIYQAIRQFVEEGGSVLVYSTDLPELQALVDRCLVMYHGQIVATLAQQDMDENRMVGLMTGNDAGVH